MRQRVRLDTGAVVVNADPGPAVGARHPHGDGASLRRELVALVSRFQTIC
jgi:hypothetical protein